jgi:hypothetical protein
MTNTLSKVPSTAVKSSLSIEIVSTYNNYVKSTDLNSTVIPSTKGQSFEAAGEPSKSFFSIQFYDANGEPKFFNFSLLPTINPGIQGYSGMSVPGAGPGIKIKSKMKHRSITIPGSTPVIQTVGVESTIIELVGIFTGFEKSYSTSKTYTNDTIGYLASSGDVSSVFRYEVVQPSVPVQLSIKASSGYVQDNTGAFTPDSNEKAVTIEMKILVTDFEEMVRQYDRTYYYIRAFVLTYPNTKRKDPKDPNSPKPVVFQNTKKPSTIQEASALPNLSGKDKPKPKPTPTPDTNKTPYGNNNNGNNPAPYGNNNSGTNKNPYGNNNNTNKPVTKPPIAPVR